MNKKVFISMLSLCVAFLFGLYIAKIFFPQEFVMVIENENVIKLSKIIDNNKILYYLFGGITAFLTYYLYCCACSHRLYLRWNECLYILIVVIVARLFNFYDPNMAGFVNTCAFIFLPALMKADIKTCSVVYTVHGLNQCLTLSIRGLLQYVNFLGTLNIFLLAIDMYFWLLLFYAIFNYKSKKGEE